MPNVESRNVTESMGNAERRVNANVVDIALDQKAKIAMLEQSVKDAMRTPNWKDIRERYIKDRAGNDPNKRQDPEAILATAKMHFDQVQAAEDQFAGEQLRSLAGMAISQLSELKTDLGYSVTQEAVATRQYDEVISQTTGADRTITATPNQPENMDAVEKILGTQPREKLTARTEEVASAMEDLKRPENMTAFMNAKVDYASLTGDLKLEDAIPTLDKAFKEGLTALQKRNLDPSTLRRETMFLVEKQLKGLEGLWTIVTMHVREAVVPKAHAETAALHESHENTSEGLSDEEMAEILQFLCEDFRGKKEEGITKMPTTISEGLDAYYQVVPAYQYYYKKINGSAPDMNAMPIKGAAILGTAQGALNVLVGVDQLGIHALNYMGEKTGLVEAHNVPEKSSDWAAKLATMAGTILNGHTAEMLSYGWNHSSAQEKIFILNKIVTEWYGAGEAFGQLLGKLKAKNLGGLGEKFIRAANVPGVKQIAAVAELISINCPRLANYGMRLEEITAGLETASARAVNVWDHYILHGAHLADTAHQAEKVLYEPTVGKYTEKMEEFEKGKATHSSAAEELREVQMDLNAALSNADKLHLDSQAVTRLKNQKTEVDKRLHSVES